MKCRRIVFGLHAAVGKLMPQLDLSSMVIGCTAVIGTSKTVPFSMSSDSYARILAE